MVRGFILWFFLTFSIHAQTYDLVIRNARVLDGAGNPWFVGDVAVQSDRIALVGKLPDVSAKYTVDARGLTLAPGFIDTHSHGLRGIQATPAAENLIRQGVTTIIEGPDGSSPLPVRPFLDKLAGHLGVNFGLMVGHGTIRSKVMGSQNRQASPAELEQMKGLARQAMLDGAFGLSTGLFYVPGNYASTEEVIELAKVVGALGGLHTSHMRSEGAQVVESVRETIRIGEDGHLPTQVTHHKIIGKANWGRSRETLRLVEEARGRGVDVTVDAYPYTASSTGTGALFPQWSLAGGSKALAERLDAVESRGRIKVEIIDRILNDRGAGDPANVVIASCGFDPSLAGKSLADIARDRGRAVNPDTAAEIAIDLQRKGGCSAIYHAISEDDIERILRYPFTMIVSDGGIPAFGQEMPHPRNYGTFARVLGRYVRERKVLTLEDAVRRMSGLPAQRFGLQDRGLIRPGMKADLVLFDPALVSDKSDYVHPHQYSVGVDSVWVNGVAALRQGKMTGQLGGRPLYGPAVRQ
ncbi:D-aminoacylase [uncultured Paludibaculum sp.]|uniref:N-acyl-D-amino-acid deacylase family protein n=1 Tax=uncultured Paludibaculum sp. TaxID=1765020 RepID=UPI002AABCF3E|nr:D-aminoacylase [uncultured Paludibaculum sp.]